MTPEIHEQGLRAYEQARAFEQLQRRRMPLFYAVFPLVFIGFGCVAAGLAHPLLALTCLAAAILVSLFGWWNWRRLGALYARNVALLARLEAQHGPDLPWLEVERHLAALDQLRVDLAQEKQGSRPPPGDGP
jgi:hypothetical protein